MGETYTLDESWIAIRDEVIERDENKCQYCDIEEPVGRLDVHHIIPVRLDGDDDMENLVTLCQRCHKAIHRLGEDPYYDLDSLENANTEIKRATLESKRIDESYSDETPDEWDHDEWRDAIEDNEAPSRATVTSKTINGLDYYYYQWREGDKVKSEYIGPRDPS